MKAKITVLIGLFLLNIASCYAADRIKGNGKIETRTFQVGDYTRLILGEGIEFEGTSGLNFKKNKKRSPVFHYTQAYGSATLKITTDENLFQWLNVKEKDGKLYIEAEEDLKVKPTEMTVTGSSSDLTAVHIHGCMDFHNKGELAVNRIRLEVSGVGDMEISDLSAREITCDVSGVGNMHLAGEAEKGNYYVSGVGKIFAYDCTVKNLKAEVSGVGNMQVMASEHLDAETSGVGNIKYKGEAKVKTSSSGIGRVKNAN
ncbi:head GIN domain-containing protein [Parabacteroides sp. PF5-6]|uniref:head GIN domain-containing protein n=1 Tax=Parabacteroides sp. PF5-6 TaxID=1742403 RepID=UPI002404A63F|nr:head GIN domain-containing protein [Parabacteroides sp. PF5-6]MDF9830566.1 hypothetical protein [Parabacteroides sp. PF5-6]